MSYDYSRNGGTNAGSGMVPHRPACKCDECTIDGLRRKIAALQRERDEAVALLQHFKAKWPYWADIDGVSDFLAKLEAKP